MARPLDPVEDVLRCAELLDQTVTLHLHGASRNETLEIQTGLAARLRENVDLIRAGKQTDGEEIPL